MSVTYLKGEAATGAWSFCGHDMPMVIPAENNFPVSPDDGFTPIYPTSMAIRCEAAMIVEDIGINLIGASHAFPRDISILLCKPDHIEQRVRNGIMINRAIGNAERGFVNVDIQLRPNAPALPRSYVDPITQRSAPFPGGTWGPASYASTTGPVIPATSGPTAQGWPPIEANELQQRPPLPPYNIGFGDFVGGYAWGCWHLYVYDNATLDEGAINDWQLVINGKFFGRTTALTTAEF